MIKAVIFDCFGVLTTDNTAPNEVLFEYIRDSLKPDFKIGLLSNAGDNWLDKLFEPWQSELFDEVVLSFEVGTVKPEPAIYQMIASRLGFLPEECVFIDDSERYVNAAEQVGMKGVWHQDTTETITKIKELTSA